MCCFFCGYFMARWIIFKKKGMINGCCRIFIKQFASYFLCCIIDMTQMIMNKLVKNAENIRPRSHWTHCSLALWKTNKKWISLKSSIKDIWTSLLNHDINGAIALSVNRSPSSRQLKKYKFFLPVEIYLLAVFMQLASKFRVFPLTLKFRDSFASVYCCSNLYNLRSFLRE